MREAAFVVHACAPLVRSGCSNLIGRDLSTLLGRITLARLDPLPERQVLARIKSATGIGVSILTQQLTELRRRVNATGDPHAPISKPAWFKRLRLDLAAAPERNEANVMIALTSDPVFAGALAFAEFGQEIVVRQPLPWDCGAASPPRPWEDTDDIRAAEWLQLRGINVAPVVVSRAVGAARELRIHPRPRLARHAPVGRHGTARIETWTSTHLGAHPGSPCIRRHGGDVNLLASRAAGAAPRRPRGGISDRLAEHDPFNPHLKGEVAFENHRLTRSRAASRAAPSAARGVGQR